MSNLFEQRREAADYVLTGYDFHKLDRYVEDVGDWEDNGDVWTIMVYFSDETTSYFTVRFTPETSEVIDANEYPLDMSN